MQKYRHNNNNKHINNEVYLIYNRIKIYTYDVLDEIEHSLHLNYIVHLTNYKMIVTLQTHYAYML